MEKAINMTSFKIGRRVYSHDFGWGVIIEERPLSMYPLIVRFDDHEGEEAYTLSGRYTVNSKHPSLSLREYDTIHGGLMTYDQPLDNIGFDIRSVPQWAKWISQDESGEWWWYENEPIMIGGDWYPDGEAGYIPPESAPTQFKGSWKESKFKIL